MAAYDYDLRPKRRRIDEVKMTHEPVGLDPHLEEKLRSCEQCRLDNNDYMPHKDGLGRILPCPLMLHDCPIPFLNPDFQPVNPLSVYRLVIQYIDGVEESQKIWDYLDYDISTASGRLCVNTFYCLMAAHALIREAERNMPREQIVESDDSIRQYLRMMDMVQRPFQDMECDDEFRRSLYSFMFASELHLPETHRKCFLAVLSRVDDVLTYSNQTLRFDDNVMRDLCNTITAMRGKVSVVMGACEAMFNPNAHIYARNDPEHERHQAMNLVQSILVASKAILVDTSSDERVRLALPINNDQHTPTYTYSDRMRISQIFQHVQADSVCCEFYQRHKAFINGVLASNHPMSNIPYVSDDFINRMRYISWRNGVFCCRTGIFYYHRGSLPPEMPQNWPYYAHNLVRLNQRHIRALKYIDRDCDYYSVLVDMLRGVFLRGKDPQIKQYYSEHECEIVDVEHGSDTFSDEFSEEQAEYVRDRLEHIEEWIHDPEFLALVDPIDVRLRSLQKIHHDQTLPRNVLRHVLETFGRCLSGVIGKNTRKVSASQQLIEKACGKCISDRLEYATVLNGCAGTGKSSILSFVEAYFNEDLIGRVSDDRRPIDSNGTIRNKAIIIASDMTVNEKPPIGSGDLKKIISNEQIVNHRLHQDSIITQFLAHVIFAMNQNLPYTDVKGDISRRMAQVTYTRRITADNQSFGPGDDRTLDEVFDQEDITRLCVVSAFAHKRRLLNVGNRSFYRAKKVGFEVPKYILATQAAYNRTENSFAAFVTQMESERQLDTDIKWEEYSVDHAAIVQDYHTYCEEHKCPQKDNNFIDKELVSTMGCKIEGAPLRVYGIKYKDLSIRDNEQGNENDNQTEDAPNNEPRK